MLQRAGLVEQGRQAQWRPCRLRPEPLRDVVSWLERYRELLGERFDRLDAYLRELQDEPHATKGAGRCRVMQLGDATTTVYADGAEFVMERVFDAPRELVWRALTEPERVPAGGARATSR